MGSHAEHRQLTLSEAEARNAAIEQPVHDGDTSETQQDKEAPGHEVKDAAVPKESKLDPGIRLYGSENRMWHAVAGHGPDFVKVKSLDFILLSIIAACGPKGILQHDLTRISGQDKRSLPARTDRLRDNGYIEKIRVCVQLSNPKRSMHTSNCILKRFINSNVDQEQQTSDPGSAPAEKGKPVKKNGQKLPENKPSGHSSSIAAPESVSGSIIPSGDRAVPTWTADRSVNNQIFELVDRAGIKGMSMSVRLRFLSPLVRKAESLTL